MKDSMLVRNLILIALCCLSCDGRKHSREVVMAGEAVTTFFVPADSVGLEEMFPEDTETEKRMRAMGWVDVREVDPLIQVHLVYATADNFVGKVLYRDIRKAFLLPEAARRLSDARKRLQAVRPDLTLLVYDAARPMAVQQEMWQQVKGSPQQNYVSNPARGGGLHNYGAAVDVTLADTLGQPLPMGCPFDYFGEEARPDCEEKMLKAGRIILPHLRNRRLLRQVMTEAGFRVLPSEWWHFNLRSREEAKKTMKRLEC